MGHAANASRATGRQRCLRTALATSWLPATASVSPTPPEWIKIASITVVSRRIHTMRRVGALS
jgi:hypothetical protein